MDLVFEKYVDFGYKVQICSIYIKIKLLSMPGCSFCWVVAQWCTVDPISEADVPRVQGLGTGERDKGGLGTRGQSVGPLCLQDRTTETTRLQ